MPFRHAMAITAILTAAVPVRAQTLDATPTPASPADGIAQALTRLGTFTCTTDSPKEARYRRWDTDRVEWRTQAVAEVKASPLLNRWIRVASSRQGYPYPEGLKDRTPQEVEKWMQAANGRRSSLSFMPGAVTAKIVTNQVAGGRSDGNSGVCTTFLNVDIECKVTEYRVDDADLCILGRAQYSAKDSSRQHYATILYAPSTMRQDMEELVRMINAS